MHYVRILPTSAAALTPAFTLVTLQLDSMNHLLVRSPWGSLFPFVFYFSFSNDADSSPSTGYRQKWRRQLLTDTSLRKQQKNEVGKLDETVVNTRSRDIQVCKSEFRSPVCEVKHLRRVQSVAVDVSRHTGSTRNPNLTSLCYHNSLYLWVTRTAIQSFRYVVSQYVTRKRTPHILHFQYACPPSHMAT